MSTKTPVIIFNGENYHEWLAATKFHLRSKKLSATLTGTEPSDPAAKAAWKEIDEQAVGKIGERVDGKYYEQLEGKDTAKDILKAIQDIAESTSINLAVRSRKTFAEAKLEEGDDLVEHLGKLERIRRLLATIPGSAIGEQELIIRVMDSLPNSWESYFEGMRAQKDLMTKYTDFKAHVLSENEFRKHRNQAKGDRKSGVAMEAKWKGDKKPFAGKCNNCGRVGHKKVDCWAAGGGKSGQGPRQRPSDKAENSASLVGRHSGRNRYVFNGKLSKSTMQEKEDLGTKWILDSGASAHMTGSKELLDELVCDAGHGTVTVANGSHLEVRGAGTTTFL